MALDTFAALCGTVYYVGVMTLGVWSGLKLHIGQRVGRRDNRLTSIAQDDIDNFLLRYFVCERRIPLLLAFSSMTVMSFFAATWIRGGYLNGTAETVYRFGLIRCQAPCGYAVSLALGGAYFVSKIREADALTMLDPFERRYGKWVSLLLLPPAICGELCWTAAVLSALGSTMEVIVQLDARTAIVISAAWACVPFFLRNKAVGLAPYPHNDWGGQVRMEDVGQIVDEFATTALGGISWQRSLACTSVFEAKVMSYVAAFGCIFLAAPPMIMGAAAKTASEYAVIVICIFSLCSLQNLWGLAPLRPYFTALGYAGSYRLADHEISATLLYVMRYMTPSLISILGLGAITSAVMSSADSSVLSAASLITKTSTTPSSDHGSPTPLLTDDCRGGLQANEREISTVVRTMVGLVGATTTIMAVSVESVYALWSLCSDAVYVVLFPQLVCLLYMGHVTNTYGLISGVSTGLVVRLLCVEPAINLPAMLKLPLYDEGAGQRFPYRTLCLLLNLAITVVGSLFWEKVFRLGCVPKRFDYCRCFRETHNEPRGGAPTELNTKPSDFSRADASQSDATRHESFHHGIKRADAHRSVRKPADTTLGDTDQTEGLLDRESIHAQSHAHRIPEDSEPVPPSGKAAPVASEFLESLPGSVSVHSTKSSPRNKSKASSEPSSKAPELDNASAKSDDIRAAKDAPSVRSAADEHEQQTVGTNPEPPRSF